MKKTLLIIGLILSVFAHAQETDSGIPFGSSPIFDENLEKSGSFGKFSGYALEGSTASPVGNRGIMFELRAKSNLILNSFTLDMSAYTGYVVVYKKVGGYSGYESSPASWDKVDSAYVNIPSNQEVTLNIELNEFMLPNSFISYFIYTPAANGLRYAFGTTEHDVYGENDDLILYEGSGFNSRFNSPFAPRVFKGKINYSKTTEIKCDTAGSPVWGANSNSGIFFDVTAKSQHIEIDQIFTEIYSSSCEKFEIYTKTGSGVGFENDSTAWTLVDTPRICLTHIATPEAISKGMSQIVNAGETRAFHIVFRGNSYLGYHNGTAIGDVFYEDSLLQIKTGSGASIPFDATNADRNFNGYISYCIYGYAGEEALDQFNLRLYPNPVISELYLESDLNSYEEIQVLDLNGKIMLQYKNHSGKNIDISHLNPGMYMLRVQSGKKPQYIKFIKS